MAARNPSAVFDDLQDKGEQILYQIQTSAKQSFAQFQSELQGDVLSPQESDDVQWAINKLTAVGILSIGADQATLSELEQDRLDAVSVLADVRAFKAHKAENIIPQIVAKALSLGQVFVLQGAQAVIAAGFVAL
jgi:hypothetical protein